MGKVIVQSILMYLKHTEVKGSCYAFYENIRTTMLYLLLLYLLQKTDFYFLGLKSYVYRVLKVSFTTHFNKRAFISEGIVTRYLPTINKFHFFI